MRAQRGAVPMAAVPTAGRRRWKVLPGSGGGAGQGKRSGDGSGDGARSRDRRHSEGAGARLRRSAGITKEPSGGGRGGRHARGASRRTARPPARPRGAAAQDGAGWWPDTAPSPAPLLDARFNPTPLPDARCPVPGLWPHSLPHPLYHLHPPAPSSN